MSNARILRSATPRARRYANRKPYSGPMPAESTHLSKPISSVSVTPCDAKNCSHKVDITWTNLLSSSFHASMPLHDIFTNIRRCCAPFDATKGPVDEDAEDVYTMIYNIVCKSHTLSRCCQDRLVDLIWNNLHPPTMGGKFVYVPYTSPCAPSDGYFTIKFALSTPCALSYDNSDDFLSDISTAAQTSTAVTIPASPSKILKISGIHGIPILLQDALMHIVATTTNHHVFKVTDTNVVVYHNGRKCVKFTAD